MKRLVYLFVLLTSVAVSAQSGVIRGVVIDQQSNFPLFGASIELLGQESSVGTTTDFDGNFILEDVPLGRQTIRVTYVGYESVTLPNIQVTAGKNASINVGMQESYSQLDEIVLTSNSNQDKAINELATVSARQFGVEEVTRFSGGRSDVGRTGSQLCRCSGS